MNTKLTEFILKYEKFYSLLSKENKQLISDLDSYGDLQTKNRMNKVELYVGKKEENYYTCLCPVLIDKNFGINIVVSEGKIRILKRFSLKNTGKFEYK